MTLWQWAFWGFAAIAAGGVLMAVMITARLRMPAFLGMAHGMGALAVLAFLFIVNLRGEADTPALAWWALGVFTAGLIGGLLFFRVLMPRSAPLWLVLGHGSVAALGLYLLAGVAYP